MRIKSINYNPAAGAFEARVDVRRAGRTFRYPCQVHAPVTSDLATIRKQLMAEVARMSDTPPALFSSL